MERTNSPGTSGPATDDTARQAAADAMARADNARQMVLNDRPTVAALQAADAASQADRADLRAILSALQAAVGQLPTRWPVIATGQAKTTALLALNASVDLVVPLTRTMPTTTYNVEVSSMTSGLVADSATVTVKARTTTSVTLTVVAKVALLANTGVSVLVWG